MQIVSHNKKNLPHYQHIVPQLSKRKYCWPWCVTEIRQWFLWAVKRVCVSLSLSLLWDEVTRVHCFCLQSECCTRSTWNMVCCFFFFFFSGSGCSDSLLWLSVLKSCCATPPWFLQPKNISSRQDMSEPIAMETVLKSFERQPPLWLHPIRF